MKVHIAITVQRDDGTTLSRSETAEKRISRYYKDGWTKAETKAELRSRIDSMVTAALNATMGR